MAAQQNTTLLAYCAGVIDSDGSISVKRSDYSARIIGDCQQASYSERVKVKQVEPHAVYLLHELFGGSNRVEKPSAKRGRHLYAWEVTDLKAADCLRQLLPYLRIKKAQAINCLNLRSVKDASRKYRTRKGRGHVGASRRTPHHSHEMEGCFVRSKELNRVGMD